MLDDVSWGHFGKLSLESAKSGVSLFDCLAVDAPDVVVSPVGVHRIS